MSSTPWTKHIKAKYFFAKDKFDQGEIKFRKCHTKDMSIDINTKPKQGKLFRIDRSKLMNVPINYNDELERANTHPDLLPKPENPTIEQSTLPNCHRSVMAGPISGPATYQESDPATR